MEHPLIANQRKLIAGEIAKLDIIRKRIDSEKIKLEGMLEMQRAIGGEDNILEKVASNASGRLAQHLNKKEAKKERRMRLGTKKRLVYALVEAAQGELRVINNTLRGSGVTPTYVRDIIRGGIEDGDFVGDVDETFSITDAGIEILERAPKPSDWEKYKFLIPQKNTPSTSMPGGISGEPTKLPGI